MTLTVVDNTFDGAKANILYKLLAESHIKGFTFINAAADFDYECR